MTLCKNLPVRKLLILIKEGNYKRDFYIREVTVWCWSGYLNDIGICVLIIYLSKKTKG